MFKPNNRVRRLRMAVAGTTIVAVALALAQWPMVVSAGVAKTGAIRGDAAEKAAEAPKAAAPASTVGYRLRCWQYGRLLFDEGPVVLGAEARQQARMVATDRQGAALLVTDAGGATCLARAMGPAPNPALPH